jgi:molecular chaperone DnaK (HSP70)
MGLHKNDIGEFFGSYDAGGGDRRDSRSRSKSLPPGIGVDGNNKLAMYCTSSSGESRLLAPEVVAAHVLGFLKSSAEEYLQKKPIAELPVFSNTSSNPPSKKAPYGNWDGRIRRAVIGVPANFTEKRREATRRAAALAGFEEVVYTVGHRH